MRKPIGLQLYPFSEALAADFEEGLARIADIGYVSVEFLGLHGRSPESAAQVIDRLGEPAAALVRPRGMNSRQPHRKLTIAFLYRPA